MSIMPDEASATTSLLIFLILNLNLEKEQATYPVDSYRFASFKYPYIYMFQQREVYSPYWNNFTIFGIISPIGTTFPVRNKFSRLRYMGVDDIWERCREYRYNWVIPFSDKLIDQFEIPFFILNAK
ncbi:unnamed protein product [Meloidogyne enterolobii]|uniref:Uncharacterized protein n=1 Tax=Meloidogyne enterolobii TaxID=390850 RepID=A0ACB1AXB5_MELEN